MDQRTFDTKVKELAEKLKKNGVAISDAQAKQMATDIISTERRAIKKQTQAVKEKKERIDVVDDDDAPAPEPTAVPDERESFQHDDPLVRRAVAQQQANEKTGGTDEGIDQDKPISELMAEAEQEDQPVSEPVREERPVEEKDSSSTQPRVTLDNPVVDGGEQKKSLAEQEQDSSGGEISLDNPVVTQERDRQPEAKAQKPSPAKKAPAKEEQTRRQPDQQESRPDEEKGDGSPEKEVDLSEMFNFSKRK